jgi:hypothetical protein
MGNQTMSRNPATPRQAPDRRTPSGRTPPDRVPPSRTGTLTSPKSPSSTTPSSTTPSSTSPSSTSTSAPTVPGRPRPARRPVSAPRHTRPVTAPVPGTGAVPVTRPAPRPAASRPVVRGGRRARPRTPFILLLVGLLGGALVSLLVISTTLAQGAFQITNLQQQNADLARQQQTLTNEVAQAGNPAAIASEASQLGMRQNPNLKFIDTKTGKIVTGKVSKADAAINVPGYNP